jgi:peptidoglycan hydrolase CwlO-like protein
LQKVVVKMTIEIALVISAISLGFAIYSGVSNLKRNNKQDAKSDSAQLTTVIVKLENIGTGINEIKADVKDVKNDLKDHSDRLIRLEQQVKVLNKTVFGKDDNNED